MSYLLLFITAVMAIFQIDKLYDDTFKLRPWIILVLLFVATCSSFAVECNKNKQEETNKKNQKIDNDKRDHDRDSVADERIKKSNKLIIDGIGEAIGKYSLGYDSAKKEIGALKKLIKDSANRKTTVIQGENPSLGFNINIGITLDTIRNDTIRYGIHIYSYSAASILKDLTAYVITTSSKSDEQFTDLFFLNAVPVFKKNLGIIKDGGIEHPMYMIHNISNVKKIIIFLKGSYTNSYNKNIQKIDEVGVLNLETKKFGIMASPYDEQIKDFLKNAKAL